MPRTYTSQPRVYSPPGADPVRIRASAPLAQLRLLEVNPVDDPLAQERADLVGATPPARDGQRELVVPGADADGVELEGMVALHR